MKPFFIIAGTAFALAAISGLAGLFGITHAIVYNANEIPWWAFPSAIVSWSFNGIAWTTLAIGAMVEIINDR